MNRPIAGFIFVSCLMVLTPLYAGTQTLTTYYPAPQGNYNTMAVKTMTVATSLTVSSGAACGQNGANVILVNNGGTLQVCDGTLPFKLTGYGTWSGDANKIYPQNITQNVDIGSPLNDYGTPLGVTGAAKITGDTSIGGNAAVGGTLTVTGNATLNGTTTIKDVTNMKFCDSNGNCGTFQLYFNNGQWIAGAGYG